MLETTPERMIVTDERITVTVLLFGQAREWAGASTVELELQSSALVTDAFDELKRLHPKMTGLERSVLFAVNEEYVTRDRRLSNGDNLAVLPPVSGGASSEASTENGDFFAITHEPLDIAGLRKRLLEGSSGAVVIFDG